MNHKIIALLLLYSTSFFYAGELNKAIGIYAKQGKKHKYQEDAYEFRKTNDGGIWCTICDGHGEHTGTKHATNKKIGGYTVSQHLTHKKTGLAAEFEKTPITKSIEERLQIACTEIDKTLSEYKTFGSTASVTYITQNDIHFLHVGDSRAILIDVLEKVKFATQDHKPENTVEAERIANAGGKIYSIPRSKPDIHGHNVICRAGNANVLGLTMSRAFGDHLFKKFIISQPDYTKLPLTNDDQYIIIASDGLWDVILTEHIPQLIEYCKKLNNNSTPEDIAKYLVEVALARKSDDDITAMVIDLKKLPLTTDS